MTTPIDVFGAMELAHKRVLDCHKRRDRCWLWRRFWRKWLRENATDIESLMRVVERLEEELAQTKQALKASRALVDAVRRANRDLAAESGRYRQFYDDVVERAALVGIRGYGYGPRTEKMKCEGNHCKDAYIYQKNGD